MRTSGWIVFAGVTIAVTGGLNAIDGLVALYRTRYFANTFVFGNLREWAVAFILVGALQIATGLAIIARQGWARWVGLVIVGISATLTLFSFSSYPAYATLILGYDAVVLYALSARWQRKATAFS